MNAQRSLFADLNAPELAPRGFRYREDLITQAEEAFLVESLGKLELKPFEFHGYLGNRRVVSFGLKYDYTHREVERASPIPPCLDDLLNRVAEFAGCEPAGRRFVARAGDDALPAEEWIELVKNLARGAAAFGLSALGRSAHAVGAQHPSPEPATLLHHISADDFRIDADTA